MTYKVRIRKILQKVVEVDTSLAEYNHIKAADQAQEIVYDEYWKEKYVLCSEDHYETEVDSIQTWSIFYNEGDTANPTYTFVSVYEDSTKQEAIANARIKLEAEGITFQLEKIIAVNLDIHALTT